MAVAELVVPEQITAAQYLCMSFEPDAEFVKGTIVERAMPTWEHSCIQVFLIEQFRLICPALGLFVAAELRVQIDSDRFRIPDVSLLSEKPVGNSGRRHATSPPYLCVEILSPGDATVDTMAKVQEYLSFGVPWIWIIDPETCLGEIHSRSGVSTVSDMVFSAGKVVVDLSAVEF